VEGYRILPYTSEIVVGDRSVTWLACNPMLGAVNTGTRPKPELHSYIKTRTLKAMHVKESLMLLPPTE